MGDIFAYKQQKIKVRYSCFLMLKHIALSSDTWIKAHKAQNKCEANMNVFAST